MKVFILATCRSEELLPYTLLVFKTFRVGFPTAELHVYTNSNFGSPALVDIITNAVDGIGGRVYMKDATTHQDWIKKLLRQETEPFWICDTDIVFYDSVENLVSEQALLGALIPEFYDEFTKTITRSRIHTSLMRIDPKKFADESSKLQQHITPFSPILDLVNPVVMPFNGNAYFHDTMSLAYHAVGGQAFTPQQKECYFHFHFGTFGDLVLPSLTGGADMQKARIAILADPNKGRGMWRAQDEFFRSRQFYRGRMLDGEDVIAKVDPVDAEDARKWNEQLCRGNQSAMSFCNEFYRYCHGIDDLIDTLRDGRPRMSRGQMISLFFNAALLYNHQFYIQHREMLFPIILDITNTYQMSVAWEHVHNVGLRTMADVFRTCGNRMYSMVALLCGGEQHMISMTSLINARDYARQHDAQGNPT